MDSIRVYALCLIVSVIAAVANSNQDVDLYIVSFVVFAPNPATTTYAKNNDVDVTSMTIVVSNHGPDNLAAAGNGGVNFVVKVYVTNVGEAGLIEPVEVSVFDLNDVDMFTADILDITVTRQFISSATVSYPADKCPTHSHLCVLIVHDIDASYLDNDNSNDYFCLPFIAGSVSQAVGTTDCPSDPVIWNFTITNPESPVYIYDQEQNITFDLVMLNAGGQEVPGGLDNIGFVVFISNEESSDASHVIYTTDIMMVYYDASSSMELGIPPWQMTTYANITLALVIPELECEEYRYICVSFVKANESALYEDDERNNMMCLHFNDIAGEGAGIIICPSPVSSAVDIIVVVGAIAGIVIFSLLVISLLYFFLIKKICGTKKEKNTIAPSP